MAGAYLMLNAIGLVAGRYQNPFTIVAEREKGVIESIDPVFYAYLAGTILVYAIGAFCQYKQKNSDKDSYRHPYHRLKY